MSDRIEVRCEKCDHVIKAPKSAAGKRGKCPHCHNSVYVPTPEEELEEIPLAPLDAADDTTTEEEYLEVQAALRREREEAQESNRSAGRSASPQSAPKPSRQINIADAIIEYLVAMQNSDLPKANEVVRVLKTASQQARSKLQQMMVDAMQPPKVSGMPAGLYQGFLRKLQQELEK